VRSKINNLLEDIKNKKIEVTKEYEKLKEKYDFRIEGRKIIWNKERKKELKKSKISAWDSVFSATVREILSIPFIYSMIIPAIFLDMFAFVYVNIAMRLYKIPLVKRSDYIVFDRKQLFYLNWIQKLNCAYCSYVN
jgi:hypothetical protein